MNKTTRLKKPQIPELDTLYTFDELGGRPKYGGQEMTSETDIPSFQQIMDETHSAVIAEATARDDADEELQSQIDTLDTELAAEVAAREASTDDLGQALDQEIADREASDTALNARADTIQGNLNAEANARAQADINLQSEIDAIVASSDVKDIVGTKAELDTYDTSTLGANDIIKVLADETQGGATMYYRWDGSAFAAIGSEGPYYTKSETDAIAAQKQNVLTAGNGITIQNNNVAVDTNVVATKSDMDTAEDDIENIKSDIAHLENTKQDNLTAGENVTIADNVISAEAGIKKLTSADYNYPTSNPDRVALWLLDSGLYTVAEDYLSVASRSGMSHTVRAGVTYLVARQASETMIVTYGQSINSPVLDVTDKNGSSYAGYVSTNYLLPRDVQNNLVSINPSAPLSALQGKTLKEMIGDITDLSTEGKTNLVAAINELANRDTGPTVVQTAGDSATDVMSQNAVSKMIFASPTNDSSAIAIGKNAYVGSSTISRNVLIGNDGSSTGFWNVHIGYGVNSGSSVLGGQTGAGQYSIAIGAGARNTHSSSLLNEKGQIAIGAYAEAKDQGAMAIGAYATSQTCGEVAFNTTETAYGYNNSNYRLLTGLYDPQNDHDAATKAYVDSVAASVEPETLNTTDWSDLWQ